jgi:FHA domain-containing protein
VVTLPGVRHADAAAGTPSALAPLPPSTLAPLPPPASPPAIPATRPAAPWPPAPAVPATARTEIARAPAVLAPAADAAGHADLLAALLNGLGAPGLRLESLTPETMQLLGQLLRESTRGAVELLVARAALKREMRAEMTMIVSRENNPLKFSPSVEVALQHLLGPPAPGFMPPAAAVRDAFDDLRAHQLGVMAGMRAALEGVLQRFDPKQLEGKLTKRSAIDSLIPATRKARLWESFTELFAQLQTEAQDDFDELFGKAFLKAYEDQLDRLHGEPGPR